MIDSEEEEEEDFGGEEERFDLVVLGRKIGTVTGWEDIDVLCLVYYNFEPVAGVEIPVGTVSVNYETGILEHEEMERTWDLLPIISPLPKEQS